MASSNSNPTICCIPTAVYSINFPERIMAAFSERVNGHTPSSTDPGREGKDKLQGSTRDHARLAGWILAWFYATAVICTWDATFIMMRPYSLPGGSLASLWYFCEYFLSHYLHGYFYSQPSAIVVRCSPGFIIIITSI